MKILLNLVALTCFTNTVVLTYLCVSYFRFKKNTLEDDGTADTDKEDS